MKKYFLFLFSLPLLLFGDNGIIVDYDFSPYMGSYDLITTQRTLQSLDTRLFKKRDEPKRGFVPSCGRFVYLFGFWDPINLLTTTVQHEIFGHGYRLRTLSSAGAIGYSIKVPFPYGSGGGATSFAINANYTLADNALTSIAGIEAEYILAKKLKIDWFTQDNINPFEITLYQNAQQSLLLYSIATQLGDINLKTQGSPLDGNDLKSYVATINTMFPNKNLRLSKVEALAFLNLLDPLTLYNIYTWWYYVVTGKSAKAPMIPIKDLKYLPNFKFSLAPYGLEYGIENYFILPENRLLMAYVKAGSYSNFYMGTGFELYHALQIEKLSLGFKGDLWYQPSLSGSASLEKTLDDSANFPTTNDLNKKLFGISLSVIGQYQLSQKGLNLYLELGGKSKGYLPGYDYKAFPTVRVGFTGSF